MFKCFICGVACLVACCCFKSCTNHNTRRERLVCACVDPRITELFDPRIVLTQELPCYSMSLRIAGAQPGIDLARGHPEAHKDNLPSVQWYHKSTTEYIILPHPVPAAHLLHSADLPWSILLLQFHRSSVGRHDGNKARSLINWGKLRKFQNSIAGGLAVHRQLANKFDASDGRGSNNDILEFQNF